MTQPIRTRSGITICGAVIAQQAEAHEADQSWRNRLMSDAARARELRRQHAAEIHAACTKNLAAYRKSAPPAPPFARWAGVCIGACLAVGAAVVALDVYLWRPDPTVNHTPGDWGVHALSDSAAGQSSGELGDFGGLDLRETQRQGLQSVGPFRP